MYGTLAEIKQTLGFTDDTKDELLARYMEAASLYISRETRKNFTTTADFSLTLVGDNVFAEMLFLPTGIYVREITTASDASGGVDITKLAIVDYDPLVGSGRQIRYSVNWSEPVSLTIIEGYTSTPPQDIVEATIALAADWYQRRLAAGEANVPMFNQGIPVSTWQLPAITARVIDVYKHR